MECVIIKLREFVDNSNLPYINSIHCKIVANNVSTFPVKIGATGAGIRLKVESGNFYSDSAATTLIGKELTKTGTSSGSVIYFKPEKTGEIDFIIRDIQNLTDLGIAGEWGTGNQIFGGVANLEVSSKSLAMSSIGSINWAAKIIDLNQGLVDKMRNNGCFNLTGFTCSEVVHFDKHLVALNLPSGQFSSTGKIVVDFNMSGVKASTFSANIANNGIYGEIRYSGDGLSKPFTHVNFLNVLQPFSLSEEFDLFLKGLAQCTFSSGVNIKLNGERTSESDDAVADLVELLPGRFFINNEIQS